MSYIYNLFICSLNIWCYIYIHCIDPLALFAERIFITNISNLKVPLELKRNDVKAQIKMVFNIYRRKTNLIFTIRIGIIFMALNIQLRKLITANGYR